MKKRQRRTERVEESGRRRKKVERNLERDRLAHKIIRKEERKVREKVSSDRERK